MKRNKAYGIFFVGILCVFLLSAFFSIGTVKKKQAAVAAPENKTISVIMDDNYPPYVFKDEHGMLQGILVDQWKLWEEKTGIKVQISATDWHAALAAMKNGEYDVIDTAFFTEERSLWLDFGKPYEKIEVPIFFNKNISGINDINSLHGFVVGVKKGDSSIEILKKNGINDIIEFSNYESLIDAAGKGKVLVFVVDKPPAFYFLYKKGLAEQFKTGSAIYGGEFHRAVKKGDAEMLRLVEYGFSQISEGEYQKINKKWFGTQVEHLYKSQYGKYILYGLTGVGIVIVVLAGWNYILQREVKRKTLEIRLEKELLRTTLFSIGDGVVATDEEGRISLMNKIAEEITGFNAEEAKGKYFTEIFRLFSEDSGKPVENPIKKVLNTGKIIGLANHTVLESKDGSLLPIADSAAPIMDGNGKIFGVIMVFRDVSEEKEWKNRIVYMSYHDELTGLYNRRFIKERAEKIKHPFAVIMADVNGLKLTNDIFGHLSGDNLLRRAAKVIAENCGKEDIAGRWSGDEFIVLIPKASADYVEEVIKKIKEGCLNSNGDEEMRLSMAMGYSIAVHMNENFEKAFKEAEESMYRQKLTESGSYRNAVINTLLATLYEKSSETEEHAERLKAYCIAINDKIKLTAKDMNELSLFAMLHDIGKVGIKEDILQNPGPLSEEEWNEMKKHSEIGYRIAINTPELATVAEYILYHHERWDGRGYPGVLKGEEIPLLCRILAVVDAYDAMTSDRSYRKAMSKEDAANEIRKNAGKQFDPAVSKIFLDVISNESGLAEEPGIV